MLQREIQRLAHGTTLGGCDIAEQYPQDDRARQVRHLALEVERLAVLGDALPALQHRGRGRGDDRHKGHDPAGLEDGPEPQALPTPRLAIDGGKAIPE
jgi:hypothetical protein